MGLSGGPRKLSVVKFEGKREIMTSYVHDVPLLDRKGNSCIFPGIEKIR